MRCAFVIIGGQGRAPREGEGGWGDGRGAGGRRLPHRCLIWACCYVFENHVDNLPPSPPRSLAHVGPTIMARLGLIVHLLVGAFVNTLIVLALLASAAVVLLWIVGRNKQLRAQRQQRYVGGCAAGGERRCPSPPFCGGCLVAMEHPPRG